MHATRAQEIRRVIEQLRYAADDRLREGQLEASRLRGLADDLERREAIRMDMEMQPIGDLFPGGICGGF